MPRKVRTNISRSKPRHSRKRISKQRRSSKLRKSRAHTRVKRRTNTYRRNLHKGGAGFGSFGYGYTDEQQQLGMSIMAGLLGAGYTAWKAWGLARTEMQRRAEQQRVEETAAQGMAAARATAEHNSNASRLLGWKQRLDGTYGPPTAANPYI